MAQPHAVIRNADDADLSRRAAASRPPSRLQQITNSAFLGLCRVCALLAVGLVVFIVLKITLTALPALQQYGWGFLSGTTWDPNERVYGILPEIWGTLYTSLLALLIGTSFGLAVAIFLSEGFLGQLVFGALKLIDREHTPGWDTLPDRIENALRNLIELLAAIPSVVYGLWGLFVVIPMIRPACSWLHENLGWMSLFGTNLSGPGVLPAVLVLSIMILPTVTALSRDALLAVPSKLRMAAFGMGATRWETLLAVTLPTAARGVFGAVVLAFGRALGETMALAMLVGNANKISVSLFSPANTLAALLANSFPEAGPKEVSVLMYAALVLLAITLAVNIAGALMLQRASKNLEGLEMNDGPISEITELKPRRGPRDESLNPFNGVDFAQLERSLRRPRTLLDLLLSGLIASMTLLALVPLFSVVIMLLYRGGKRLGLALFTEAPPAPLEPGGGFGNAIIGTIVMVGLAGLLSIPAGVLTGVYLAEAKPENRLAQSARFAAKILTGFPSILAGVFAYGTVVLLAGGFSAWAGATALSVLMLPTIVLTAEDAIRMVPSKMREASIGMGATTTQTVTMVLLPTALPGILTGIMLAIARAAGETAPLLFTALFSNYWLTSGGHFDLVQPTASLAVLIYNFASMPFDNQVELAWAAALVLVLLVLAMNLTGQALSRRHHLQ